MPQSRHHATNGPCLAIWERMEKEPHLEPPHENSTCSSVSSPTSSCDGNQSPVFALQKGEEHNGWLSVHPRLGSGQISRACNLNRCASMSLCIVIGRVELQVDPHAVVLPHANKDSTVLQSSHSIHAGGTLSSCEIFSICCCVNISIAVWAGPVVPSMGRLSINGH